MFNTNLKIGLDTFPMVDSTNPPYTYTDLTISTWVETNKSTGDGWSRNGWISNSSYYITIPISTAWLGSGGIIETIFKSENTPNECILLGVGTWGKLSILSGVLLFNSVQIATTNYGDSLFHHVFICCRNGSTVKIIIDGTLVYTSTVTITTSTITNLYLFAYNNSPSSSNNLRAIKLLRIYDFDASTNYFELARTNYRVLRYYLNPSDLYVSDSNIWYTTKGQ